MVIDCDVAVFSVTSPNTVTGEFSTVLAHACVAPLVAPQYSTTTGEIVPVELLLVAAVVIEEICCAASSVLVTPDPSNSPVSTFVIVFGPILFRSDVPVSFSMFNPCEPAVPEP